MPNIKFYVSGGLAILAGISILIAPKLTRWAIGFYLIIAGVLSFVNF